VGIPGAVSYSQARRYQSMRPALLEAVRTVLARHPGADFYLTGHSLGATQSILGLADLATLHPGHSFRSYPAAAYRNTDEAFNRYVAGLPNVKAIWRITHAGDNVPAGRQAYDPAALFNYRGLGVEVWYPSDERPLEFVVCDSSGEDPACINSVPVGHPPRPLPR
jgi:putative lipase involved disintegration of autophagic bodies